MAAYSSVDRSTSPPRLEIPRGPDIVVAEVGLLAGRAKSENRDELIVDALIEPAHGDVGVVREIVPERHLVVIALFRPEGHSPADWRERALGREP